MADYNPELVTVVTDILKDILNPDGTLDYYVDYHDMGCLNSAEDIETLAHYLQEANGDIRTAANYALFDSGFGTDLSIDYENYLRDEVEKRVSTYDQQNGTALFHELDDLDIDFWEFMEYCGYNGVNIPAEEFYPNKVCLEIKLATYEEANHEGYIIDFFGGYYPHESHIDDPEMRDNMLVEFMQSQGLQPEDVDDESKSGRVLDSVRQELINMTSNIDFLTVCASFDLYDASRLLSGQFNSITINPGATMGIFDGWNGGGSVFEIEIETPWTVSADNVERVKLSNSSDYGYSVAEVYGISPDESGFYNNKVTVN